jgi:hypothetical protein
MGKAAPVRTITCLGQVVGTLCFARPTTSKAYFTLNTPAGRNARVVGLSRKKWQGLLPAILHS